MNPERYTQASVQAGERYLTVLQSFRGLLQSALIKPFSERTMSDLRADAKRISDTFARTESTMIRDELQDTASFAQRRALGDLDAVGQVQTPEALQSFLEQSGEHLELEVGAQLARDVEALVRRYREFALEAQVASYANGFAGTSFGIGRSDQDRVRFYFRDRAGRLIPSQRFVRLIWRQSLIALGAEFYLLTAISNGATSCLVDHADPNHRHSGRKVDIGRGGESFIDLRDEVFHPNSDCILKATADVLS